MSGPGNTPATPPAVVEGPMNSLPLPPPVIHNVFNYRVDQGRALAGDVDASVRVLRSNLNDNPTELIINRLRANPELANNPAAREGLALLERNEGGIRDALSSAIRNDETVARGLVLGAQGGAGAGGMNPMDLLASLKDPRARTLMTQVLTAVGHQVPEGEQDRHNMTYLERVGQAARRVREPAQGQQDTRTQADYENLRRVLQEANIHDTGLSVMAAGGPMSLLTRLWNDPMGLANDLPGILGMQGDQAQAFAQLLRPFAQYIELCMGGEGGYREFLNAYVPSGIENGRNFIGRLTTPGQQVAAVTPGQPAAPAVGTPPPGQGPGGVGHADATPPGQPPVQQQAAVTPPVEEPTRIAALTAAPGGNNNGGADLSGADPSRVGEKGAARQNWAVAQARVYVEPTGAANGPKPAAAAGFDYGVA